jgi:palmitoyltransferase
VRAGYLSLLVGVSLYLLLNWSYATAVFTDPGSPLSPPTAGASHAYAHVPSDEPDAGPGLPAFTVKSTGGVRFCKKCRAKKPDRAHHCSTCRRCVLKMDHHCPWLATCVGLGNYKAFLLFCLYTTVFCWVCFAVAASTLWSDFSSTRIDEGFMAVNMVLLAVLGGILGLVLAGFTGWHINLAVRGQTTIECLEKTRYLSPLRKTLRSATAASSEHGGVVQRYGQQLAEMHANALPGITRQEEGEERPSPPGDVEQGMAAAEAVGMSYGEAERERERQRYEDYLDERDSEKLPNAFDLGWRRNLRDLFGARPLLRFLPVCNSVGDGWHWEPSPKWLAAREEIRQKREREWREQERREQQAGWGRAVATPPAQAKRMPAAARSLAKANQILGRSTDEYADRTFPDHGHSHAGSSVSMKTLRPRPSLDEPDRAADPDGHADDYFEVSSDEELGLHRTRTPYRTGTGTGTGHGPRDGKGWREWE